MSDGAAARREVVCLHGFTGAPAAWDAVVDLLPADVVVHRPPLLGHDPSTRNGHAPQSFAGEVDRLVRWIAVRAAGPVVVAGYSLGARLALGLLVRHRELFAAATLVGVHPGPDTDGERRERAARDEALARRLENEGVAAFVDEWERLPLFASQQRLPAPVLAAQRALRMSHAAAGLAQALRNLGPAQMPDYRPALPDLDLPVHLLAGEDDDKFCRTARQLADALPCATVEIVAGAGHNLILEAPHAVAAAIQEGIPR